MAIRQLSLRSCPLSRSQGSGTVIPGSFISLTVQFISWTACSRSYSFQATIVHISLISNVGASEFFAKPFFDGPLGLTVHTVVTCCGRIKKFLHLWPSYHHSENLYSGSWLFPWKRPKEVALSKGTEHFRACQIIFQKDSYEQLGVTCVGVVNAHFKRAFCVLIYLEIMLVPVALCICVFIS